MKSSLTTATCTSTIAIVNVTSKVAAFAFFLASVLGVVYGNTYVSLSQKERISCESCGQFTFDDESVILNAFGFISVYIYITVYIYIYTQFSMILKPHALFEILLSLSSSLSL